MTTTTSVRRSVVVATLRSRDLHGRADWVEKELPALIDTSKNASMPRYPTARSRERSRTGETWYRGGSVPSGACPPPAPGIA
jgi:hypothetical protein